MPHPVSGSSGAAPEKNLGWAVATGGCQASGHRGCAKPWCPGDTGNVVRGYSSTQRRVFFSDNSFSLTKETFLWKLNSGLVLTRGALTALK